MSVESGSELNFFRDLCNLRREVNGASLLITGATGLIGNRLFEYLAKLSLNEDLHLKFILLIREERTKLLDDFFKKYPNTSFVTENELLSISKIDYIIHCASITQSEWMIKKPVEVFNTNIFLTEKILKWCLCKNIKSFLYVSSMEVYGSFKDEVCVTEEESGIIDPLSARSSYSISKKATENLCYSYYSEYGLPIKIARPTLTFGPGVSLSDNRVFAQFAKSVVFNQPIVLRTDGMTKRDYLYIDDAVKGLVTILFFGKKGEAYNLSNPDTYMSILDMANLVSDISFDYFGSTNKVSIIFDKNDEIYQHIYAPLNKISLNIDKARALGWSPEVGLRDMFIKLIDYYFDRMSTL